MLNQHTARLLSIVLLLFTSVVSAQQRTFEEGHQAYAQGDHALAFSAFTSAAENGDSRAFGRLGGMYLYGVGTERSFDKAYLWFTLAKKTGDRYAEGFQRTAASMLKPLRIGELQAEADKLLVQMGFPASQ